MEIMSLQLCLKKKIKMKKEPWIKRIKQIFKENINPWKSVKSVVTYLVLGEKERRKKVERLKRATMRQVWRMPRMGIKRTLAKRAPKQEPNKSTP